MLKYSHLFTATNAISQELVTVRVELIEASDAQLVSVESLEGEYLSPESYSDALNPDPRDKIYSFIPLTVPDARQLHDALTEALQAARGP